MSVEYKVACRIRDVSVKIVQWEKFKIYFFFLIFEDHTQSVDQRG